MLQKNPLTATTVFCPYVREIIVQGTVGSRLGLSIRHATHGVNIVALFVKAQRAPFTSCRRRCAIILLHLVFLVIVTIMALTGKITQRQSGRKAEDSHHGKTGDAKLETTRPAPTQIGRLEQVLFFQLLIIVRVVLRGR